ncbi:hypothetical protein [Anaerococcus sp. Marseille-P3625]|uniref:hypothetical protein n=1 Tax=Anaerococcus sp. Marseille-P3625 TaxID=1977277 RepID=UPI000C06C30E|nr:hypothetical protein [Anaerococcus sp. Marseille-P3625]
MNKKLVITSLVLALAMTNLSQVMADDVKDDAKKETKIEEISSKKDEKVTETYVVKEIKDDYVILNKKGFDDDLYQVEKNKFDKIKLEKGKELDITSDGNIMMSNPAQFSKIYEIKEVKKEDEKLPEEKITDQYLVKEVNEQGVIVEKIGSESEKYMVEKKYFKGEVKVGEKYNITHNDVVMTSNPAIFNKIYDVEKIEEKIKETATITNIYKVKEVNEQGVTLSYYSKEDGSELMENSEDLYTVAKKEFKDEVKVGDKYKITHSDEILTSDPAQFAKITKIEKVKEAKAPENKKPEEKNKNNNKDNIENKKNSKDNKDNKKPEQKTNEKAKTANKNPKTGVESMLLPLGLLISSAVAYKKSKNN